MASQTLDLNTETLNVSKRDLIQVWSILEKLAVSIRKIGSQHAIPVEQGEMTEEQVHEMMLDLDRFITPQLLEEIGKARSTIVEYLPADETEYLAEFVIDYWKDAPGRTTNSVDPIQK